jgi:hypothetical protein
MRLYKIGLLLACVFVILARAQEDPHVHSEHKEQLKATLVYTDKMYLLKTPEQTVDVEFNFRLRDKKKERQPERIDMMIWSRSTALKFEKDRKLTLSADGSALMTEKVIYMPFKKDNKKPFERVSYPGPQEKAGGYTEWIIVYLNPAEAKKLAGAQTLKLQIGSQEFSFTDNYMKTVRDFAGRIPAQ